MNTIEIIRNAVAEEIDMEPSEVSVTADLNSELEIDSLVLLEILLGIEDELEVHFSKEDFKTVKNINEIAELVEKLKSN